MREHDHRHLSERAVAATLLPASSSPGASPPPTSAEPAKREGSPRLRRAGSAPPPPSPSTVSPSSTACPLCRAKLEEAARLALEFHARVLPRTLPCIHQRVAATAPSSSWRWLAPWLAAPLAVAAALLLFPWPRLHRDQPSYSAVDAGLGLVAANEPAVPVERLDDLHASGELSGEPELRTKSASSSARVLVRRGETVHRLADGALVHPGDALAFLVDPGPSRFALVVSIDGASQISVYSPFAGASSGPVPASALTTALEPSIILDDTLGPERIWLLISDSPLSVADLRPTLERLAAAGPAAVARATAEELLAAIPPDRHPRVDVTTWLFTKVP